MSFAQEMKDFVSAFKIGSDIVDRNERTNLTREKQNKKTAAEIEAEGAKAAGDAAEKSFDKGYRTSAALPSVGGSTSATNNVGDANEVESTFMETVRAGDDSGMAVTNPYGLAAVAATGKAESSWKPTAVSGSWPDPSESGKPGTSGGLMSWRNDRFDNMRAFTSKTGNSPAAQAAFFLKENPSLIKSLNNAKSLDEAMAAINNAWAFRGYNDPNSHEVGRRRGYAEQYLKRYGQGGTTAALPVEGNDAEMVAFAAEGGVIDPEEAEVEVAAVPEGDFTSVRALPIDGAGAPTKTAATPREPTPRGPTEDATNSPSGGSGGAANYLLNPDKANEAVAAGMDWLTNWLEGGAAIGQAAPDRATKMQAFAMNANAPTSNDIAEIDRTIDPKGELAPHLRSIARLNGMYDFYLKQGNPEKASKMAWSMAQYARKMAMSGGAQMQALIEKGNMAGAAKVFEKVYEEMPNGNDIKVKPVKGGIEYKVFDIDGNPTDGGRLAIDEVMRLATGMQNGTAWFQGMGYMAGQYKEQQRGKGNRMSTPNNRAPSAPRLTAAERAAQAEAQAETQARGQRGQAVTDRATALQGQSPDLTPSETNVSINTPPELATVEGVPQSALPVQGKEWGAAPSAPDQTMAYNAGTGVRKVMPEEAQGTGEEERAAGQMSTATERGRKERELVTGARTDEALVRADKEYNARANRKGVRTTDSASNRQETAEQVAEGFKGATTKDLPADRAGVVNSIATKIIRGNDGLTAADAGRVIGDIMMKGPAMRGDGTVGARGGGPGVFLDSRSIKQLADLYGGKLPSAANVDPKLTPRDYRMPKESGDRPQLPGTKRSRAESAGAKVGAAIADIVMQGRGNEPPKQEETPQRRNRYNETWRKRQQENKALDIP